MFSTILSTDSKTLVPLRLKMLTLWTVLLPPPTANCDMPPTPLVSERCSSRRTDTSHIPLILASRSGPLRIRSWSVPRTESRGCT